MYRQMNEDNVREREGERGGGDVEVGGGDTKLLPEKLLTLKMLCACFVLSSPH